MWVHAYILIFRCSVHWNHFAFYSYDWSYYLCSFLKFRMQARNWVLGESLSLPQDQCIYGKVQSSKKVIRVSLQCQGQKAVAGRAWLVRRRQPFACISPPLPDAHNILINRQGTSYHQLFLWDPTCSISRDLIGRQSYYRTWTFHNSGGLLHWNVF